MDDLIGQLMKSSWKNGELPTGAAVYCVYQDNDNEWCIRNVQQNKFNSKRIRAELISFKEPILIVDFWQMTPIRNFYIALYKDITIAIPEEWINTKYFKVEDNGSV